jgi:hypothetical protein
LPTPPDQGVHPGPAVEVVVALAAVEVVVAAAAVEAGHHRLNADDGVADRDHPAGLVAVAAVDHVVPVMALEPVLARATLDVVARGAARGLVFGEVPMNPIVAVASVQRVLLVVLAPEPADDHVIAAAPISDVEGGDHDPVVAGATLEVAPPFFHRHDVVVAAAAIHLVVHALHLLRPATPVIDVDHLALPACPRRRHGGAASPAPCTPGPATFLIGSIYSYITGNVKDLHRVPLCIPHGSI